MKKVIEGLGLDFLLILVGRLPFEDAPLPYPRKFSEVRAKFDSLEDEKKLDDAVAYCAELLKREEDRADKIESKASSLIGFIGVTSTFIIGFATLVAGSVKLNSFTTLLVAALLILASLALMLTIYLAMQVVHVGNYKFTYPSANDIFAITGSSLAVVKQERAASLFYSFAQNTRLVNRKASFLQGAQIWFRNSIFLLLILTVCLAILYITFGPNNQTPVIPTPTILSTLAIPPSTTLTATATIISPTFTQTIPTPTTTNTITPTPTLNMTMTTSIPLTVTPIHSP
jgi:hypothetical protein